MCASIRTRGTSPRSAVSGKEVVRAGSYFRRIRSVFSLRSRAREAPTRTFTVGDLGDAVAKAYAAGMRDDALVLIQARRGVLHRRYLAEVRLDAVDWLQPTDNERVFLLVARRQWRRR